MTGLCEREGWHPIGECGQMLRVEGGTVQFTSMLRPVLLIGDEVNHDATADARMAGCPG